MPSRSKSETAAQYHNHSIYVMLSSRCPSRLPLGSIHPDQHSIRGRVARNKPDRRLECHAPDIRQRALLYEPGFSLQNRLHHSQLPACLQECLERGPLPPIPFIQHRRTILLPCLGERHSVCAPRARNHFASSGFVYDRARASRAGVFP